MKKLLVVAAAGAAAYALVNKRKKAAEAEAKLWDEATGTPSTGYTPPPAAPAAQHLRRRRPEPDQYLVVLSVTRLAGHDLPVGLRGRSSIGRAPPLQGGG